MNINLVFLEGKVVALKQRGEGLLVKINQIVAGQIDSNFVCYLTANVANSSEVKGSESNPPLKAGDILTITGGTLYVSPENQKTQIRVSKNEQLSIKRTSYYLGEIDAAKKFF